MPGEYAKAGVDYKKIEPFKQVMVEVSKKTLSFPNSRDVIITRLNHGANFQYTGNLHHSWQKVVEGLGNKNWIAEWMYMFAGTGETYYENIPVDAALMAVNDLISHGALPILYMDEIASGDSEWFEDGKRNADIAKGFYEICQLVGMALGGGESPSLRYLIKPEPPVKSAPSFSGCAVGIVTPVSRLITGEKLQAGDHIVGATSSGLHANGISLIIKRTLTLPEQFLTTLPDGRKLGEHALIPTRSYVALVEALLEAGIDIHGFLPGTGDGVGKIAFDKRPFTYRIKRWVEVPLLFQFMREIGVSLEDCLKTFNWGIGFYIFLPKNEVELTLEIGKAAGYELYDLGEVEEGERCVIFEPEKITLPPPGE